MVDGCGYDSQLKCTICEACRLYHSILSILDPEASFSPKLRQIRCTFESLRCLNPKIWQFLLTMTTTTTRPITLPLAHVCGGNYASPRLLKPRLCSTLKVDCSTVHVPLLYMWVYSFDTLYQMMQNIWQRSSSA